MWPARDPARGPARARLEEDRRAGNAVRVELECKRPIAQMGQHERRDVPVVLDQVTLGKAVVGPQHFAEMGEAQPAPIDDHLAGSGRLRRRPFHRAPVAVCSPASCTVGAVCTSTWTSGVATATVPYSGHLPLKSSTSCCPCAVLTPWSWNWSRTVLKTVTSGRTGRLRSRLACMVHPTAVRGTACCR